MISPHPLPELGLIEGFYGTPWTWQERARNIAFLAPHGYRFYLYAPKADAYLRRQWQVQHSEQWTREFQTLSQFCKAHQVRVGLGISPFEIYLNFDADAQQALAQKLAFFDQLGIDDLAILFDDMRGDVPQLAQKQAEIVHWAVERTSASRILVCPSYYSDDPVLDRVFGKREPAYLSDLGRALDPQIEIMWTGEEVCSRAFSSGHLKQVAHELQRKPFLWDNYPVNDGQRMSQYLHLRGFTGRQHQHAELIAAHGVNPSLQATLALIPMLTLTDVYRQGEQYQYRKSAHRAAIEVLGAELGDLLHEDILTLQDIGLDRLAEKADVLRQRYQDSEHAGAREIIAWLDGVYRISNELVQTQ